MSFIIIVMLWLPPVVRVGGVSKVETFADSMPAVPPAAPLPCSLTAFPAYCSCSKVQVLHSFFLPSRILLLLLFYFLLRTTQFILFFFAYFFLAAISQVCNAFVLLFFRRFRLAAPAAPKRRLHSHWHSHSHSLSACLS